MACQESNKLYMSAFEMVLTVSVVNDLNHLTYNLRDSHLHFTNQCPILRSKTQYFSVKNLILTTRKNILNQDADNWMLKEHMKQANIPCRQILKPFIIPCRVTLRFHSHMIFCKKQCTCTITMCTGDNIQGSCANILKPRVIPGYSHSRALGHLLGCQVIHWQIIITPLLTYKLGKSRKYFQRYCFWGILEELVHPVG